MDGEGYVVRSFIINTILEILLGALSFVRVACMVQCDTRRGFLRAENKRERSEDLRFD